MASQVQIPFEGVILQEHSAPISCPTPNFAKGSGKSFRSGLLAALEKLQLPYEESLSSIRLTSVEADLQVAVQSWMGTGQIKVRQAGHRPLLKRIVNGMNDCFRQGSMGTNRISWLFWVAVGLFALILGIDMYFP